jgi:hypothetical protein
MTLSSAVVDAVLAFLIQQDKPQLCFSTRVPS